MSAPLPGGVLRFRCTGCGDCCRARGRRSFVYTNLAERQRLARYLGLSTATFTKRYCERTHGFWHLREPTTDCVFLDGARCTVYAARPIQCRTFPFWQENVSPDAWKALAQECPGVDQGPVVPRARIERAVTRERRAQERSD